MKTQISIGAELSALDAWYLIQHASGERFIVNSPVSIHDEIELLDENDEAVYLLQPGNYTVAGPVSLAEAEEWLEPPASDDAAGG